MVEIRRQYTSPNSAIVDSSRVPEFKGGHKCFSSVQRQFSKQSRQEHPLMHNIMGGIKNCNLIGYAAYRTAAKMHILHTELCLKHVRLRLIIGVFERHKLSAIENSVTLDETEMEDVISDIYFAAHKEVTVDFDVNLATKLTVHFILTTFDSSSNRKGEVCVLSVKLALILMSCGKLNDKYEHFYELLADDNGCLSKCGLRTLLENISKVAEILGESAAYGSHLVESSIDSCFPESQSSLAMSEAKFTTWLMQDPPSLNWISTFHRIKSAEHTTHNVKCSSCQITPVHGPRFSCLRCARYHQCLACFLAEKVSSNHKLTHPVREYCMETSRRKVTKLIVKTIRKKLKLWPTETVATHLDEPSSDDKHIYETHKRDTKYVMSTGRRKMLNAPQEELESIINHLEDENKRLHIEFPEICGSRAGRLQRHRATVESQLQRLQIFKHVRNGLGSKLGTSNVRKGQQSGTRRKARKSRNVVSRPADETYLFTILSGQPGPMVNRIQSTPMLNPVTAKFLSMPSLEFELSPIARQAVVDRHEETRRSLTNGDELEKFDSRASRYRSSVTNNSDSRSNCGGTAGTFDNSRVELSTWIGGGNESSVTSYAHNDFSHWLHSKFTRTLNTEHTLKLEERGGFLPAAMNSAHALPGDNALSLSEQPDERSQHSDTRNIQGGINDILNRLQHMFMNDSFLEEKCMPPGIPPSPGGDGSVTLGKSRNFDSANLEECETAAAIRER